MSAQPVSEGVAPRTPMLTALPETDVGAGGASPLLVVVGLFEMLVGAWGAIAPFVGPTFGYTPDGVGSWQWTFDRGMLSVLPGCAAIVAGLFTLACASAHDHPLGRSGLQIAALLGLGAGAWFALGAPAFTVLYGHYYLVPAAPSARFANDAGALIGPGLAVMLCAGICAGFLARAATPIRVARAVAPVGALDTTSVAGEDIGAARPID